MVIHQLLEAVSHDGNYAINIPLTPQGELDPGGEKTLVDMGSWMDVNSEGIYDSSAWDVWGEGKVTMKSGNLSQTQAQTPYTAEDIRFTTKNGAVYAYLMAWPSDGQAIIHSLANSAGKVRAVSLLGSADKLDWQQTDTGPVVHLPAAKPCLFAYELKVEGDKLTASVATTQ